MEICLIIFLLFLPIHGNRKFAVDFFSFLCYNSACRFHLPYGGIAQLVEHSLDVRRVRGSSPFASTKKRTKQSLRSFFIQSEGLVCNQRARALYGIAKSRTWHRAKRVSKLVLLRIDSMHHFVPIPCRNKLRIPSTPSA